MKIQCDVCEKAEASVICSADEAALCVKCDVEVHAANKLASKHQRLLLQSNKLPSCDICREKAAFIFCVEDRALFCKDCDEPIHANTLAANHQRFLATGIRVALNSSNCSQEFLKNPIEPKPPKSNSQQNVTKMTANDVPGKTSSPSWAVDDLLHFSDYDSSDKKEQLEFNELDWLTEMNILGEQIHQEAMAAAEVPQLRMTPSSYAISNRSGKWHMPNKKPRIEILDGDEEYFAVPDLG